MTTEPIELAGKVKNGVVVLDPPGGLEDGTPVRIQPLKNESDKQDRDLSALREMLLRHAGEIEDSDLPRDLAENLEHHLYSTPINGQKEVVD